ncbi:MAG: aspartate kinase, partial [candidate division Zixibacteria bacterium]
SQLSEGVVLVASAMAKTTNSLQEIACRAEEGDFDKAEHLIKDLESSHLATAKDLLKDDLLDTCSSELNRLFVELGSVVKGLSLLKERTTRSNDLILSFGERLSTVIIANTGKMLGMETHLLDSRTFMKTDDNFTQAALIDDLTYRLIREQIEPYPNLLIVTQGFIASTDDGTTTTLGRNQSDFTAIVLGAALSAEEVQIWTDVDGIMTSDPRLVRKASTIGAISYREAAELAHFGARVIHPSTIQPAVTHKIPVWVRNTGNPDGQGTKIVSGFPSEGPKAISFKRDITVINITSGRMLMAYGFLKAIFEIFERYETSVDLIATSEVSVSMTIDEPVNLELITRDLKELGIVSIESDQSIICLVGQDLWKNSEIISRVFSTLQRVPIRMISLGSSDTNLSLVVPQAEVESTVKSLHKEFFEK